ncbi:MAG: AAA family ATPase, partial [Bacteroidota bacterium]|nr:AAA family ATPase [Bacteroidota bacterium]
MYLSELSLVNFKNIKQADFQFSHQVNCFLGNNGQGKTNLLDAIYYLSYTKSFFNSIDSQNVNFQCDFFVIQGKFLDQDSDFDLYCAMKKGDKKVFRKNKKVYKKLSDHIGVFPVVMITPYDINLILEGSDTRRRFIDALISQFDNHYLSDLLSYNKLL